MNERAYQKGFSTMIILMLIAVLAVAGGTWVFEMKKGSNTAALPVIGIQATGSVGVSSGGTQNSAGTSSMSAGSSDSSLDTDSADVKAKLNALNSDATSVDAGLNDQQGNLSEQ